MAMLVIGDLAWLLIIPAGRGFALLDQGAKIL